MKRLENKVAIVTGAGRGLGKGIALKLAEEGAKVVVADMAPSDNAVKEIEQAGGEAASFCVNVAKQEEVKALVEFAVEKYGTLDIMVNNAGINRDGKGKLTYIGKTSMEVRVDTFIENSKGMRRCINRAYVVMVAIDHNGKPMEVPRLKLETENERIEWNGGKKRYQLRKSRRKEGY